MFKNLLGAAASLLCSTALGHAGGVERSIFNPGFLFENGDYVELSFGSVSASVSGTAAGGLVASGDMASTYSVVAGAMKQQVTDAFALGLVIDQPVGVAVSYPTGGLYPFRDSVADVSTMQVSVLGHYQLTPNVSVYGGLRANRAKGSATVRPVVPTTGGLYSMSTDSSMAYGYVAGAAYERPEIALRVSLSYVSAMTHDFAATDNSVLSLGGVADFSTTIPQSVNLDFQTGVAANTLVFGSLRWREWSSFTIKPHGRIPLSEDNSDTVTYSIGVGRKFSDTWSGAVSLGFEPSSGDYVGNLGPTDGFRSVTLAGIYTVPNGPKITIGATYGKLGDALTEGEPNTTLGTFTDNSYVGVGVKVGWNF